MRYRTIHDAHRHYAWDNAIAPVATAVPGETLTLTVRDAWDGVITRDSGADILSTDMSGRVNPVTGPVYVDGTKAGDTLVVKLESYRPSGWGWTANIPGFGLLTDDFRAPALRHWTYDSDGVTPLMFGEIAQIPLAPFAGTIGVAPAAAGPHDIIPPRRTGGNMDIRDLVAGSVLYLPVEADGALLSIGDTHAAQGDGEVCGTAIESPMEVTVTLDVAKDSAAAFPRLVRPGARPRPAGPADVTTGIGPDLYRAAQDAVRGMIDLLAARHGLAAVDAYMLCSVAGDLAISQIVDAPNWTVSFHMPRGIFA
ncbi:MAG: acetamidase/formamidase family protein, partial [Dichotomicrobium sp.]